MPPVKGKAGLTATMWVLLVVLGLLVIVGVVLWMMTKGQPNYNPSRLREPKDPSVSLFKSKEPVPVACQSTFCSLISRQPLATAVPTVYI